MYRRKKIIIGLVLILSITVSTAWAQTKDVEKREKGGKERIIHFVHTGAINGYIKPPDGFGGWAAIAGFVNSLRKEGETVFLLDAGDGQWGSGAALVTGGETPARLANATNYDAILLGNLDVYSSSLELLDMPLIRGNSDFYKAYGAIPSAVPFTTIKKSGISVGIIGALYGPPDKKKPYKEHRKMVRRMKRDGIDVIILLAHDAKGRDWNEYKKMGVDVVLAHWSQFRRPDKDKLVKSTGMAFSYTRYVRKGRNLGHLKLKIKRGKSPVVLLEEEVILNENKIQVDKKVNNIAKKEKLRVDIILNETVGEAAEDVSHSLGRISPAGELILNAIKESTNAEIVIYNSPGIRAGLKKGIIKYSNLVDMLPFGSSVVTFELRGQDLQEFARSYNQNVLASGIKFGKVIRVNNKLLDPERYYLVASNDYLLQHGSGPFQVLKKGSNKIYYGYDIEALRNYVRKNSPIKVETAQQIYESARNYQELGETYFRKGEKKKAIATWQKIIELNPDDAHSYMQVGRIYKRHRLYGEAISAYEKVLQLGNEQSRQRARRELVELYEKTGRLDELTKEIEKQLRKKVPSKKKKPTKPAKIKRIDTDGDGVPDTYIIEGK
ncbi:5'-nucleotidase C-terminal domain-containing protein [bacterium]|nr:5'-nucleotidase C-terminal domain-containing protein [bacterium]